MKVQTGVRLVLQAGVFMVLSATAQAKDQVMLTLEEQNGVLVVDNINTSGPPCPGGSHPGCFEIGANDGAEFRVRLKQSHNECQNADWKLLDVRLGGETPLGQPGGKPASWGGISTGAAQDFNADQASGEVRTSWHNHQTLYFEDANAHAFSIWYMVRAESCHQPGYTISMDPRIDNKGTGGSG